MAHHPPRVALKTLGCRLNQFDTAGIREQFTRLGYELVAFDEEADVYVVNTCTVTARADRDARRLLRQAKRRNPDAVTVATGCYAQVHPWELAALPEVDLVLGNGEKAEVAEHLLRQQSAISDPAFAEASAGVQQSAERQRTGTENPKSKIENPKSPRVRVSDLRHRTKFDHLNAIDFDGRARGVLKVQDGCDAFCTYCIIPFARGASRSLPVGDVVRAAQRLVEEGFRELVLVGVHLGVYGRDLDPPRTLADAARALLRVPGLERIRLSSVEPVTFTDDLIDLAANHSVGQGLKNLPPRICRHFHLPVQSGDAGILRRMNRKYSPEQYAERVLRTVERIPGAAIGTDVLVGFPGESDEAFQNTFRLINSLPITHLHVFTFSPRPGTAAAKMRNRVDSAAAKDRCRALIELGERKRRRFVEGMVGTVQDVLFENRTNGTAEGLTDTYVRVLVKTDRDLGGEIHPVRITGTYCAEAVGELVSGE